jgi:hypothetical protein
MSRTRREFLQTSAAAVGGSCLAAGVGIVRAAGSGQPAAGPRCLDYGRSFIRGTKPANNVRFWVESRTTIIDDANGTSTDYFQCASCKSENTFAEKDLFMEDNYDFLPILGDDLWLVFRRFARISPRYRTIHPVDQMWGELDMLLHDVAEVTVLDTFEKIRDATAAGLPLVTQTELRDAQTGLRAIIECPTKTMNISLEKHMVQVDTGPIALPDLSRRFDPQIDSLRLAFIAFNAPHFADFVVEQPTAVVHQGQEKCQIFHYSAPFSMPAKNVVLALGQHGDNHRSPSN